MVECQLVALGIWPAAGPLVQGNRGTHGDVLVVFDGMMDPQITWGHDPGGGGAIRQGRVARWCVVRWRLVWGMLQGTACGGGPSASPLGCRLCVVDGLGCRCPRLVVESPHGSAGMDVAGVPGRNDPTTVFAIAQQQGLMTLGLAGLGGPEWCLFRCPIGDDVRVDGPSVNEVH